MSNEAPLRRALEQGLLRDPVSDEALTLREGWLWNSRHPLYPVFDGIPIIQPAGVAKMTGLLHRLRTAQQAIETATEHGPQEVFAPGTAVGMEKKHVGHRAAHCEDAGKVFGGIVARLTADAPAAGWCLDLGCGYGFDMLTLCAKHEFVVGLDPQLDRCVTASRLLTERGFSNFLFLCGGGEELPLPPGRFHLVTANQVVEHVAHRPTTFGQIQRVLRPGGHFVFALPTRYSLRPEPHVYLFFLGWLPRFLQGPYAALRGRGDRYADYTNLVSHWRLRRELREAFGSVPRILSAPEAYEPARPLARRLVGAFRMLLKTPLRALLLELEGAMVGMVRKPGVPD